MRNITKGKTRQQSLTGLFGSPKTGKRAAACVTTLLVMIAGVTGSVDAAPPTPFDNWSNAGTTITAPCPAGFTCHDNISDEGMLQRSLTAPDGNGYFQLIVREQGAAGEVLTSESYVNVIAVDGGVSAKQTYVAPDAVHATNSFKDQSIFNIGWAAIGNPAIQIDQALDTWYNADSVHHESYFGFQADEDVKGQRLGSFSDIWQKVTGSTTLAGSTTTATGEDVQVFVSRHAAGTRVPSAGSIVLPASTTNGGAMMGGNINGGMMGGGNIGTGMNGGGAGGTLTWQPGNEVQMTWMGQRCIGCTNQGGMGMDMATTGDALFGYQTADNLVDALPPISSASLNVAPAPFDWADPPFGAAPSINMAAPTF